MGDKNGLNVNKVIGVLKEHRQHGVTLTELMAISGLSYSNVLRVFDELEDKDVLMIKSDGLSRIYSFRE